MESLFGRQEVVENCPHTRGNGIIFMTPQVIAAISGAVEDEDEWAIVLKGKREDGGHRVTVTDFYIPPQERGHASVEIDEIELADDDVGVLHSHNSMNAFMSTTDDTKLNPRFPVSIVIAQKRKRYLGFDYQAEGRVTLPCGSIGVMKFLIQPTIGPEVAVLNTEPQTVDDLGDCSRFKEIDINSDLFHIGNEADCGLRESGLRADAFGADEALLAEVKELPRKVYYNSNKSTNGSISQDGPGYYGYWKDGHYIPYKDNNKGGYYMNGKWVPFSTGYDIGNGNGHEAGNRGPGPGRTLLEADEAEWDDDKSLEVGSDKPKRELKLLSAKNPNKNGNGNGNKKSRKQAKGETKGANDAKVVLDTEDDFGWTESDYDRYMSGMGARDFGD